MKIYIYLLAAVVVLASCGGNNNKKTAGTPAEKPRTVSASEAQAISEITRFYGGECTVTSGKTDAKDGSKNYVKLTVSKSPTLDSNIKITELNASNIALVFYKDMGEEKTKYDEIHVEILFSDGQKADKVYPLPTLDLVLYKSMVVVKIVEALRKQEYDALDTLLDDKSGILNYNKKVLIDKVKKADPALGKITSFIPYGFIFFKSENNHEILHMSGVLIRDKQQNEFSVDLDPLSDKEKALFINYKL